MRELDRAVLVREEVRVSDCVRAIARIEPANRHDPFGEKRVAAMLNQTPVSAPASRHAVRGWWKEERAGGTTRRRVAPTATT
jgi:hypothetical protein